jgi:hypothetical protein
MKKDASEAKLRKIDPGNLDTAERQTMKHARNMIVAIERALSAWKNSSDKPAEMQKEIERYRRLHGILVGWESQELKASSSGKQIKLRMKLLWEFADICRANNLR